MSTRLRQRFVLLALGAALAAACGGQSSGGARDASDQASNAASSEAPREDVPVRPEEAESDAAYYQERAAALAGEDASELERTDFERLRRGRLYAPRTLDDKQAESLDKRLVVAAGARDHQAALELSAKVLAEDQTDVHAHLARSVALRKLGRSKQAEFHFELARRLSQSILESGDGKSAESAITVYSAGEEQAVLKVKGLSVEAQERVLEDGRAYDVVKARKSKGGGSEELYFDVSALHAERQRTSTNP
jgi:tetratricopeptide (TPR) repeat protein